MKRLFIIDQDHKIQNKNIQMKSENFTETTPDLTFNWYGIIPNILRAL